jgi:hypothetical protein
MDQQTTLSRRLWEVLEGYHSVIYFAPEKKPAYEAVGLKGGWMGYFASRSAPLGPVGPDLVAALFYNFHPRMVHRALPDAWTLSDPKRVTAARLSAASEALTRLLEAEAGSPEVAEAASLAGDAARSCEVAGRPMFAAYSALEWPRDPHVKLWHAATLLREYRGDAHVASLLAAGLDGCQAHITLVATGYMTVESIKSFRGWSDEEWGAAEEDLRTRGLMDRGGRLTDDGVALRAEVERVTDERGLPPLFRDEPVKATTLLHLMEPLVGKMVAAGGLPFPNPMGLLRPA